MRTAFSATTCPDPESLAAFAEGTLSRNEIADIVAHLDTCADCSAIVEIVSARTPAPVQANARRWRPLAIAASVTVIVAAAALAWMWLGGRESGMSRLVAAAPRDLRAVEPRLGGAFPYARFAGPARADDLSTDAARMKLVGIAGDLVSEADRSGTGQAQHAAGIALLLIDRPENAIERLRAATDDAPRDATRWSDLAAAQYAAARRLARPSLLTESLASCDRALDADPRLAAALFNRALALESLGLRSEARDAWNRFLAVDASSGWAAEARAHVARLSKATGDAQFGRDRLRLEAAVASGDRAAVAAIVQRYPQRSRTFAESEYLADWAAAFQSRERPRAERALTIARAVGEELAADKGEYLLRHAVHAIDAAGEPDKARLAQSHVVYRRGRIALSRQMPDTALPDLSTAASGFAGSPMAFLARFYAANARFDSNDLQGARDALERLKESADPRPELVALAAQIRNQLAVCAIADARWTSAIAFAGEAESRFHKLGERGNEGFAAAVLAAALIGSGRVEDAWAARTRAFALLDAEGLSERLAVAVGDAVRTELAEGRLQEARALLRVESATARKGGNDALLAYTLVRAAVLESRLGDDAAAQRLAGEATAVAQRLKDPAMRARSIADAQFAQGAVVLHRDPQLADARLTRALAHYDATRRWLFVPESLLLRARARLLLDRAGDAEADLLRAIALIERRDSPSGSLAGTGALDVDDALFEEAIRLRARRRDAAGVFAYAERWRARSASTRVTATVTLRELQSRLAGTSAAILDLSLLGDEIVALAITEHSVSLARTRTASTALFERIARATGGNTGASRELYDQLIRPVARDIADAHSLIVIAGPPLRSAPFSSLFDSEERRFLVQRFAISTAPSAAALEAGLPESWPWTIATLEVEDPAAGGLSGSRAEIAEVTSRYPLALSVPPTLVGIVDASRRADILHISGHTQRQPRTGGAALPLALGVATGEAIAASPLHRPLIVVLAACETLHASGSGRPASFSLGDGFLAAGAADVIGTLRPIADEDARALFGVIHEQLAHGTPPAEAVRNAQIEAIAHGAERGTAWRSIALLTRRFPRARSVLDPERESVSNAEHPHALTRNEPRTGGSRGENPNRDQGHRREFPAQVPSLPSGRAANRADQRS